jgi:hypothetical protein
MRVLAQANSSNSLQTAKPHQALGLSVIIFLSRAQAHVPLIQSRGAKGHWMGTDGRQVSRSRSSMPPTHCVLAPPSCQLRFFCRPITITPVHSLPSVSSDHHKVLLNLSSIVPFASEPINPPANPPSSISMSLYSHGQSRASFPRSSVTAVTQFCVALTLLSACCTCNNPPPLVCQPKTARVPDQALTRGQTLRAPHSSQQPPPSRPLLASQSAPSSVGGSA